MKKIFFITGASGVGKTTFVSILKEKYKKNKNWLFLHFDSIFIPSVEMMVEEFGSVENWQKEKTDEWINKMVYAYPDKEVIIFEGSVNLQFIKDGFSKNNFSNYKIILLDCEEKIMEQRLVQHRNQPELWNENMKNWLQYIRSQAQQLDVPIIDTSHYKKEELGKIFEEILEKRQI